MILGYNVNDLKITGKDMKEESNKTLNEKFACFAYNMMIIRLINAGKSNISDRQSELVAGAFNSAYKLLRDAKSKCDVNLFNRVYNMAHEIVPSSVVVTVMKQPKMYEEMLKSQLEFNNKVKVLLENKARKFQR